MRHISFALTTPQIRDRSKTVTRRLGWRTLAVGTLLQPIVKGQGLKKGETVERIGGPIRVVNVRRELLYHITQEDVVREGFPAMRPYEFIEMFMRHHGCDSDTEVTRIEFMYVD